MHCQQQSPKTEWDRLVVNGESFTLENLHNLPADIKLEDLYTKTEEGVTFFFRKRSPLSNHHHAPFEVDGKPYCSSEQYYFAEMSRQCRDKGAFEAVMGTTDPLEMMSAGRGIRKQTNKWMGNRVSVMEKGVREKVLQNPHVRACLLNTKNSKIAEASPNDIFFGIGHGMNDEDRFENWGQNHMGSILEKIRSELS